MPLVSSRAARVIGLALASAVPVSAMAQDAIVFDYSFMNVNSAIADQAEAQAQGDRASAPGAARSARVPSGVTPSDLSYRYSASQRTKTLDALRTATARKNPAQAADMERFLATPDLFGLIERGMAPMGLEPSNVADAFAMWWMSAWMGSRGQNDPVDRATASAVKRQAEAAMLASPGFGDLTDAKKQEMAESYLIQAALIDTSIDGAKHDPAILTQVKQAIAKGAKASGMDLSTVTLTQQGFVPATRTTGASDPVPGSEPAAVATNEGSSLSPLLYVGAGAGVAALVVWAVRGRA